MTDNQKIESLQDSQNIKGEYHGNFLYGSGYIEGALNYYVLIKYDKGYKIEKFDSEKSYLVFDNNEMPRIERYNYLYSERVQKKWFMGEDSRRLAYYRIYLPENAIQLDMQYKIDLK
jgi:hypothetical protein